MWDFVKGLREIHDNHISLFMTTIQSMIKVACHIMVEPVGLRQTSDFGNYADSQQEIRMLSKARCLFMFLTLYVQGFCNRCMKVTGHIVLISAVPNLGNKAICRYSGFTFQTFV